MYKILLNEIWLVEFQKEAESNFFQNFYGIQMTAKNLITYIFSRHLGTLKINGKLILPPSEIQ